MQAQLNAEFPLIDEQKLQSIRALGEPDDADGFFKDLVGMFFERVPHLMAEIEVALQKEDSLGLERSAHALKGTAGHLGAIWMMKLAEHIETMGRQSQAKAASNFIIELKSVYPLTCTELQTKWL